MTTAVIAIFDKGTMIHHILTKQANSWGWKDYIYWAIVRTFHSGRDTIMLRDLIKRLDGADASLPVGLEKINLNGRISIVMQMID